MDIVYETVYTFVNTHCGIKTQTGFIWLELKSSDGLRILKGRGIS
jgi:hypothetical protein